MKDAWTSGNRVRLLENGEAYFPRVFDAIRAARFQVLIETFILYEDKVGLELKKVLIEAARRGVSVVVSVDGWGSPPEKLSEQYIRELAEAGVKLQVHGEPGWLGKRLGVVRRLNVFHLLHRKMVVIDGRIGFIGGINFSADHLADFGPESKQDYAVELQGPIVDEMHAFLERTMLAPAGLRARWLRRRAPAVVRNPSPPAGTVQALLTWRDNRRHRNDIERHYRLAIRTAREEVTIANAYFFPSYTLLRELRRAARRGVRVSLILQGQPDMAIVPVAARLLYHYLIRDGVTIYEYCRRPLHAKVALVDDVWATVGSSNLDPFSLSLQLEANVVLRDAAFNRELRARLNALVAQHCVAVDPKDLPPDNWWRGVVSVVVFHVLRHFPWWLQNLPIHRHPGLSVPAPPEQVELVRSRHE
ncbi:MAG TPA: cardiolipin synthase ClsB [Noviherbaspirillum sp.]